MTVTSVTVKHDGWSASMKPGTARVQTIGGVVTIGAKIDFTVVFLVETDDRLDGPQVVAGGNVAGVKIPAIGDFYEFGNDIDQQAFCNSVAPKSIGGNLWEVTCVYGPRDGLKPKDNQPEENPPMQDKDGNPTDDPMLAATSVQVSLVHMKEPVDQAVYAGQWWAKAAGNLLERPGQDLTTPNGAPLGEAIKALNGRDADLQQWRNHKAPVCNSVGTPFDPPVERDHARINLRITRNHRSFPVNDLLLFQDTINSNNVLVLAPHFRLSIAPHEGKMMNISGTPAEINGFHYYRVTYEVHVNISEDLGGGHPWRPKILDRGLTRVADAAEDLAHDRYDKGAGMRPGNVNIKDTTGQAISEPVLLNGAGKTLNGDVLQRSAVWLEYAIYQETSWAGLKLDVMNGFADD